MIQNKIQSKIEFKSLDKIQAILGPELQANWDMSEGDAGWVGTGATISALTYLGESSILIEQNTSGNFKLAELAASGMAIGLNYRVSIRAAADTDATQQLGGFSYAANSLVDVDSLIYENYDFDIAATASSGVTRCYASTSAGANGNKIYVSEISIREIL